VLLLTPYAGLIVDRSDKRTVLLATQASLAALSLTLGVLVLLGAIQLWMVFAVALGFGVLTALDNPARMAFIPEMVGPKLLRDAITLKARWWLSAALWVPWWRRRWWPVWASAGALSRTASASPRCFERCSPSISADAGCPCRASRPPAP